MSKRARAAFETPMQEGCQNLQQETFDKWVDSMQDVIGSDGQLTGR